MKLLTHNLLQSPGTRHGYPLAIEAEKVETVETEFNPDFLVRMVEKLDYPGLVTTIATVRHRHTLAARPRHALTQRARDTWSHRCSHRAAALAPAARHAGVAAGGGARQL